MINAGLSEQATLEIEKLQHAFQEHFGENIWAAPPETLHITLLDWLAPLVSYEKDKDALFNELLETYEQALKSALADTSVQNIVFNRLIISPGAITITADTAADAFNHVRNDFLARAELLPGTKMPPNIVHSTILRFVGEIAMSDVENFANTQQFEIYNTIETFRLVRETRLPMLEYSVIKEYSLG